MDLLRSTAVYLALQLLLLAAARECPADERDSKEEVLVAVGGLSRAMVCFGDAMHEMAGAQRLASVDGGRTLDVISDKITLLTDEMLEMKQQLLNKNKTVEVLAKEIKELKGQLEDKDDQVQDLTSKLEQSHGRVQQLENSLDQVNRTKWSEKCAQECVEYERQQDINALVLEFQQTSNWRTLYNGLVSVLEGGSPVHSQLLQVGRNSSRPLRDTGSKGFTELVSLLLCAGLPVDSSDSNGAGLLHGAVFSAKLRTVRLLLGRGADPNGRGSYGMTPLILAAQSGDMPVIKELVRAGARTDLVDSWGRTALSFATRYRHSEVVRYLQGLP